jgi:glycogen debranching enzyme
MSVLKSNENLKKLLHDCLSELVTDQGINASGKGEVFGCIFGRDSAITILKLLNVYTKNPSEEILEICRKGLLTLVSLQGKEFNLESGEEPGKFVHEFRDTPEKMARLLAFEKPWYVYPDNTIKNYDSIDSTPLTLIALYNYYQITQDGEFLMSVINQVDLGLNWIITFGDKDKDSLIEYELPKERKHGGLLVQSWTDSHESLMQLGGRFPNYPIAPVEAQGYAWLALKLWADFYQDSATPFAQKLLNQSVELKKAFNKTFLTLDQGLTFAVQALDGDKNQIVTITGNPLLLLWASYQKGDKIESILNDEIVNQLVKRSFMEDMFDETAGIRTMSTNSPTFNSKQDSYHNGSFWPVLNGMAHEGLERWGFKDEADRLKKASLLPLEFFNCPIELYTRGENGEYLEFCSPTGQTSCKNQAWTVAAALDLLT